MQVKAIQMTAGTDYYFEVKSPVMALKEQGIEDLFVHRAPVERHVKSRNNKK